MTSQEARQQLNACENQIAGTYGNLRDAARSMGSSAVKAASGKTMRCTLLPLIISLFGIILCLVSHPVWGAVVIIAGIVIAYSAYQATASVQSKIEDQQRNLNSVLDNNSKI